MTDEEINSIPTHAISIPPGSPNNRRSAERRQSAGPEAWHRQGDPRCMSVHVAGGYGAVMPPLSRRSSRPLYLQISDDLRTQILQQQLRPGERLASEHS